MDYETVLAQVLALLQQEHRLSYRVLKHRLHLDDDLLDDIKEDLIYAKKLAVDEEGRVLVWAGSTAISASTPLSSAPPRPEAELHAGQASQRAPVPSVPHASEAERRQLTVLFCDLVESTRLARQLDPEDYREVVRAYQAICATAIQRFDGTIAQYLGDGLLVYFGYPQAHEDDAQRAVRAGLGMLDALVPLQAQLVAEKDLRLAVRLGIHTGLVVVGAVGTGGRQEQLALGDTPNVAARLQGLAAPDTVVVGEATWRLVQGYFAGQDLGLLPLKGLETPVQVYRVLGPSGAQSRLDVVSPRGLTPLVGRGAEVALLHERWAQARDGMGQVVLLSGEAGIGKSRLVLALKEQVAGEPHTRWECRCSSYFQDSTLYPLIDLSQRALQFGRDEASETKLQKIAAMLQRYDLAQPETVALWAALLSVPLADRYPPLHLTPQRQKQKTLEAIGALLRALAAEQPVLLIVEDLHWIDPSTLEWLTLLIDQGPVARLLLLLTYRPEFPAPWGARISLTPLTLTRLPRPQVAQMSVRVAGGKALPPEVVEQIVAKTDGVPLFVEELTKTVLESGLLREGAERYELTGPLPPLAIPTTLHDSLMARLDRLAMVKDVAQLGATIGRTFAYELLQAVSPLDHALLQQSLRQLVDAELVYQQGVPPQATYLFKHALIQDAAYQSLLRSTRQQYHQRIAQVLEAHFAQTAETQPELVAYHYTAAGLTAHAIPYWQRAGRRAYERSAYVEAISYLTRGLELLQTEPDTPGRLQQEMRLQSTLGVAYTAAKGYAAPEVEGAYSRARTLCQQLGDTQQLFLVLIGLWNFYFVRGALQTACELGEQLLALAENGNDPVRRLRAHGALGESLLHIGHLLPARAHLEQGIALSAPQQRRSYAVHTPTVACLAYAAWALWHLGYPDQALQRMADARTLAQALFHPLSSALALHFSATLHQFRREAPVAQGWAEAAMTLARDQGLPFWDGSATILWSWALAAQGRSEEGLVQLHQGLRTFRATGAQLQQPSWLALLAEVYGWAGQATPGLEAVAEALAIMDTTGERYYAAEVYRLKGELLWQSGTAPEVAEAHVRHALTVARQEGAKSWELRAAVSLSRLWQQQDKRAEAYELLAPIYGWFTEGFDTADFQEAKALLEELAGETAVPTTPQ